jgi:uncharacterized protein (DUF427 family)
MEKRDHRIPGEDHPITIEEARNRFTVKANGSVVADSQATLTLNEAGYPPVQYFPAADVDMSLLRSSATSSYCPYKGDATYFDIVGPDSDVKDAIWTYEDPYPEVKEIAGYLAFYPDRVEITSS